MHSRAPLCMVLSMSDTVIRVGLVQMKSEGRADENLRKAIDGIAEAQTISLGVATSQGLDDPSLE